MSKCDGCKHQYTEDDSVVYDICLKCNRGFREGTPEHESREDKYEAKNPCDGCKHDNGNPLEFVFICTSCCRSYDDQAKAPDCDLYTKKEDINNDI